MFFICLCKKRGKLKKNLIRVFYLFFVFPETNKKSIGSAWVLCYSYR